MDSPFPQLRLRTECTFRRTYAPIPRLAERLSELGATAGGCVDPDTWGHVRWERALLARGIEPLFGAEFQLAPDELGRRPVAWVLAEQTALLYRATSAAKAKALSDADFAAMRGCVRFAGAALSDPASFDYIDVNPASTTSQQRALALHKRTRKPLVLTCDNYYPRPDDLSMFQALGGRLKVTPQWVAAPSELRRFMPVLTDRQFKTALHNTIEVAERLKGVRLLKAPMIKVTGNLRALCEEGIKYRLKHKHIAKWTAAYKQRLERELSVIAEKSYESYFLVVSDLVRWAKSRMLVGPARGSSAGSLVCYLTRITEVDPLVHDLLFERFVDINRSDLPDIDIDFSDKHRDEVFAYLADKYGSDFTARLGTLSTLKPRSALTEVAKQLGIPLHDTKAVKDAIIEYSSGDSRYGKGLEDTFEQTIVGKQFLERHPAAVIASAVEGHAWHTGIHAAGVVVCNDRITNYCTVADGVAQIDKPDAEYLNLLKIDALGLRTLGILEDVGVPAEQLYGLTLDDQRVFDVINAGKYAGVFQFEGPIQRRMACNIHISSFREIDHITALSRPGPLGGGASNRYIQRHKGAAALEYQHPSMEAYLKDTLGVVLYQEQVMRIVRELGDFSWEQTTTIRKAMSGRKGEEFFNQQRQTFVRNAVKNHGMTNDVAELIWKEIFTFGAWGMNKSHTVSYSIISYWCAWMKAYKPIEYAAACLRGAKDDDQTIEVLRELRNEGVSYVPFDVDRSDINWVAKDGVLVGGFLNLVGVGPAKAHALLEARQSSAGLSGKQLEFLRECKVKFTELRPAHALWGDVYANPQEHGIAGTVKELADIQDDEEAVFLGCVMKRIRQDDNEDLRIKRRGGERRNGQTLFVDLGVVDDSLSAPIIVRLRPRLWEAYGERIAERAKDGEDWFLFRGRKVPGFTIIIASKVRCLNKPNFFDED